VLDFGLAKLDAADAALDATQAATMAAPLSPPDRCWHGAVHAPEQFRGGAVMPVPTCSRGRAALRTLAGRRPFGGATPADVSSSILRTRPRHSRTCAPICRSISNASSAAVSRDARARFQTALDVCKELPG